MNAINQQLTAQQLTTLSSAKRELLELWLAREGVDLSRSAILPQKRDGGPYPLSFAQQRLWFLQQLAPDSAVYNLPVAVRLTGRLDVEALRRTLNEILRRHEVLRTTFGVVDGQPVQVIAPELRLDLPVIEIRPVETGEVESGDVEAEVLRWAAREARRPFDLAQGPLLRGALLRLADEDHVLMLTMHHIVSDGWSVGVLVREVAALYEAFGRGAASPLPELSIQYLDYALWQRQWLQGAVLEEQIAYWEGQLAGSTPTVQLPTDRPRPAVPSDAGAIEYFELPTPLAQSLRRLSRASDATLFMTLLAAFETLLYRYSGQEDFNLGSPIANRNRTETEELIGFFVNFLVLRADLSGNPTFRELLARVRETTLAAYDHQDLPFEMLVERLQPERNVSRMPLFQVIFDLNNNPTRPLAIPGLSARVLPVDSGTAHADVVLNLFEEGERLHGRLEYSTDLFEAATIRRMLSHFQVLLEGIVTNPDEQVAYLPLLPDGERHRLLRQWNKAERRYPKTTCLHEWFETQAERTPENVAVSCDGRRLTYRELNARANQLARHLRRRGVGPDVLVGMYVERSLEMVVGILGVLKAGGAYVPIDTAYPEQRLAFMLDDTQAPVLLTQESLAGRLPAHGAQVVRLDADWPAIARESEENLPLATTPDSLAYVIYTSGSTGKPKGVRVSHYNVVRLMQATEQWYRFDDRDVWTLFHSYAFDFSVWELWGALLYGGRLVVVPYWVSRSPELFYRLLVDERVTVLNQTPSAFRQLMQAEERAEAAAPLALRLVIFGGEALDLQSLKPWFDRHGDQRPQLVNMYGITETTVHVTYRPIRAADLSGAPGSVIGRAIPDLEIYVLDRHLQPVPIGVPGEMYVGGAGVARGYLNRPELTEERFVGDPFRAGPDARLYKTGDLARYLPDGDLEYLGRIDDQVKIRGFRIELGEIEAALGQHPDVREVVVLAREDTPGEKRLVAYVVPAPERAPKGTELRAFVQDKLPDYMIPSAFVTLDALPLTSHGKVDRRALPAPQQTRPEPVGSYVAPRGPVEELLADLWADVLRVERVGVEDNFFALGGHSLLATRLVSRLRDTFQVELPLAALFETPTIAALAEQVEKAGRRDAAAPRLQPVRREGPLPLSYAQQRLWFLEQWHPGNPAYMIPAAVRLVGRLDLGAMRQSFDALVQRHESLRTSFRAVDGQPVQVIHPPRPLPLPVVDLSALPGEAAQREAQRLVEQEAQEPFDLAEGPLLRLRLLRLGAEEHIALVTMHHIVSDAWSIGVFIEEFGRLYAAFVDGRPSPLAELPLQYADVAAWQREWLEGGALEEQLAYWRRQLAGLPVLALPTDRPRPAVQTFHGAWESHWLSADLSQAAKALGRREGVTLFMTLLAAFKTLLARYTGQDDIVVGADIAGRNRRETEGLIGLFVNQLVLRTDLSGDVTFRELLQRVRAVTLAAYAHQDLPFEKLVEELQPERDVSRNPLFQVMFILQNAPMPALELPGLTLQPLPVEQDTSVFDLSLIFVEQEDGRTRMLCRYNTDLFEPGTIARMLRQFATLLSNAVARPDDRLSALDILTEAERKAQAMEANQRKQSKFDRLTKVRPQVVDLSRQGLVKTGYLEPGQPLPLVVEPAVEGVDLVGWARSNRSWLEQQLHQHGALLVRGFGVPSIARFEEFAKAVCPDLMDYGERSSPRHKLGGFVYTSTDHPPDQPIVLHNEQSYTLNWMMKLLFFCAQPAARGGRTPIADSRRILERLRPSLVQRFDEKQILYMRNFGQGLGLSWQEAFQTDDRAQVEAYCREHGITFEWIDANRLRTRQVRPAIRRHPKTGQRVWFNHAMFFHITSLEPETREALLDGLEEEDLPFNTYYGDGTPFEPEVLEEIRGAYAQETVSFPWHKGDILLVDNMLAAHGREPFEGPRQVVVVMGEPYRSVASTIDGFSGR